MELHVYEGYPLFLQEAIDRWHSYPPPCYGYYVIPWLWFDGNQHGGGNPAYWDDSIISRLNKPAPVTITAWGYYSPGSGNGTIFADLRNDSTSAITASVLFVITEDSIHYAAPNGDSIHNHVVRDFLPDHIGTIISIQPSDSASVNQAFTIPPGWDPDNCVINTMFQDTVLLPDSTKNIFQCAGTRISNLSVAENGSDMKEQNLISVKPNPSSKLAEFTVNSTTGGPFSLRIYNAAGRLIKNFHDALPRHAFSMYWDLKDDRGKAACPGVYFYTMQTPRDLWHGKLVIQ
jgi:hypothetical protein